MNLEVNGVPYNFFTSISVESRIDALARQFSFEATKSINDPLPFNGGDACRVLDGDDVIATGHIERINIDYDSTGHRITLSGRDRTGDLIDSSFTNISDLLPPVTLTRCIQRVAENIGGSYSVIDTVGVPPFETAADMIAPEPGQNAFEFIEKLARKRQVLLTSDGYGRIIISRAGGTRSAGSLQNILGADDNNIISSTTSYDETQRFRNYEIVSGLNPLAAVAVGNIVEDLTGFDIGLDEVVNQRNGAEDSTIRRGRQLAIKPESQFSDGNSLERARWELNIRRARGRMYSVVVQGFREVPGGSLWAVNTLVRVVDEFAGINGDMLINGVTFNFDEGRGSTTTLSLVASNSYTLELSEPKTEKIGLGFTN